MKYMLMMEFNCPIGSLSQFHVLGSQKEAEDKLNEAIKISNNYRKIMLHVGPILIKAVIYPINPTLEFNI